MRLLQTTSKEAIIYEQFGYDISSTAGNEVIGNCVFCNKDNHFYVNKNTLAFSCKRCGQEGSWRYFLKKFYEKHIISKERCKFLSQKRGIPLPGIERWKFAEYNGKFFLPAYDTNLEVSDLRMWKAGGKEHSIKGGKVGLVNLLEVGQHESEPIYICEAYFTAIALDWLLKRTGKKGVVVSTGGANTFREDWMYHFNGRKAIVCFDHDEAGYGKIHNMKATGSKKVEARIQNSAKSVSFVTWPKNYITGS